MISIFQILTPLIWTKLSNTMLSSSIHPLLRHAYGLFALIALYDAFLWRLYDENRDVYYFALLVLALFGLIGHGVFSFVAPDIPAPTPIHAQQHKEQQPEPKPEPETPSPPSPSTSPSPPPSPSPSPEQPLEYNENWETEHMAKMANLPADCFMKPETRFDPDTGAPNTVYTDPSYFYDETARPNEGICRHNGTNWTDHGFFMDPIHSDTEPESEPDNESEPEPNNESVRSTETTLTPPSAEKDATSPVPRVYRLPTTLIRIYYESLQDESPTLLPESMARFSTASPSTTLSTIRRHHTTTTPWIHRLPASRLQPTDDSPHAWEDESEAASPRPRPLTLGTHAVTGTPSPTLTLGNHAVTGTSSPPLTLGNPTITGSPSSSTFTLVTGSISPPTFASLTTPSDSAPTFSWPTDPGPPLRPLRAWFASSPFLHSVIHAIRRGRRNAILHRVLLRHVRRSFPISAAAPRTVSVSGALPRRPRVVARGSARAGEGCRVLTARGVRERAEEWRSEWEGVGKRRARGKGRLRWGFVMQAGEVMV